MTEPAEFDSKDTPHVVLGGKKWPVALWTPRQLRKARAALLEMNDRLTDGLKKGDGKVFLNLPNEDFERLVMEPVFYALTRLHPDLKYEEFLDWPTTDAELVDGWFVVRDASGVFVKVEKVADLGEARAARMTTEVSRTGTR